MGEPMNVRVQLSDEQQAVLRDCLDGQEIRVWAFRKIKEQAASFAQVAKAMELVGHIRTEKQTIYASDLKKLELTEGVGNIEFEVGPKLKARIEWGLAFEEAAGRLLGARKPVWTSPNEWCQVLIEERLAAEAAKSDDEDIDEEEKALFPKESKEK